MCPACIANMTLIAAGAGSTVRREGVIVPRRESLVTFELFADGDKTRLKLAHEDLETFPKTPAFARKSFMQGWTQIIGSSLKEFVEAKGPTIDKINHTTAPGSLLSRVVK